MLYTEINTVLLIEFEVRTRTLTRAHCFQVPQTTEHLSYHFTDSSLTVHSSFTNRQVKKNLFKQLIQLDTDYTLYSSLSFLFFLAASTLCLVARWLVARLYLGGETPWWRDDRTPYCKLRTEFFPLGFMAQARSAYSADQERS